MLSDINRLDRVRFVAALGGVFEHSPWVATQAWAERPFASIDHLHHAMMAVVRATSREVRIDFFACTRSWPARRPRPAP